MRRLIVTADDFGLTPETNAGIIEAHTTGLVTSTSLLMNGTATDAAIALAAQHPSLEVGLHLSIVEGKSLTGLASSVTDELRYFDNELCLHRDWQRFIRRWLTRRIDISHLEAELRAQIEAFLAIYKSIPFANGTQHLHVLPGVQDLVMRLAAEYGIRALRIPQQTLSSGTTRGGGVYDAVLRRLAGPMKTKANKAQIRSPQYFGGFDASGRLNGERLLQLIENLPSGTTEIMAHPGHDSTLLRQCLPRSYRRFDWRGELDALCAPGLLEKLDQLGIKRIGFRDL